MSVDLRPFLIDHAQALFCVTYAGHARLLKRQLISKLIIEHLLSLDFLKRTDAERLQNFVTVAIMLPARAVSAQLKAVVRITH